MNTTELAQAELGRDQTIAHYRDTVDNYELWSPEGNLHFGYWRRGLNPISRRQMLAEMNRQVITSLAVDQEDRGVVLDLGCGVGAIARWGSEYLPQLHWKAINISSEQLRIAKRQTDNEAIEFVCEDYHCLNLPGNSAIGAYFVESLCYSISPVVALAEVARILRPGSRIVIADGYLKQPLERTSAWFRRCHDSVAKNWAVPRYHEIDQLLKLPDQLGLRMVECREISWRISLTAIQSLPLTAWCALRLARRRETNPIQWKHLVACANALLLGLHRRQFGYYLLVLEKPV